MNAGQNQQRMGRQGVLRSGEGQGTGTTRAAETTAATAGEEESVWAAGDVRVRVVC